jgi:hypothetical protein
VARPKADTLQDWLMGTAHKRLALARVLEDQDRDWTEREICDAVGADRHSSVGTHLESLAKYGLMRRVHDGSPRRYRLVPADELSPKYRDVRDGLGTLLSALSRLDEHD